MFDQNWGRSLKCRGFPNLIHGMGVTRGLVWGCMEGSIFGFPFLESIPSFIILVFWCKFWSDRRRKVYRPCNLEIDLQAPISDFQHLSRWPSTGFAGELVFFGTSEGFAFLLMGFLRWLRVYLHKKEYERLNCEGCVNKFMLKTMKTRNKFI